MDVIMDGRKYVSQNHGALSLRYLSRLFSILFGGLSQWRDGNFADITAV